MGRPSKFEPSLKAKVAIEALKETKSLQELAREYEVSPALISQWKEQLLDSASEAFVNKENNRKKEKQEIKAVKAERDRLYHKVGQLTLECDFFAKACEDAGLKVR